MKAIGILLFTFILSSYQLNAAGGIYDSFSIVNLNGSGATFYDLDATTANPDLQGANLGSLPQGTSLVLGGQTKTFKNNSTDITGVQIFYRFYLNGSAGGSFTGISYAFQWDQSDMGAPGGLNNSGDQQWGTDIQGDNNTDQSVDILSGMMLAEGTYTLEVYVVATTNGNNAPAEIFDSNGGDNYTANFTVSAPLPVVLTSFTGTKRNGKNYIEFTTTTEVNNDYFEVQRSAEGRNWRTIGMVQGNGTTETAKHYEYIDETPLARVNYYRLKQIDFDGQYEYSPVITINNSNFLPEDLIIYPNPATNQLNFSPAEGVAQFQLVAASGQLMKQEQIPTDRRALSIDIRDFASGYYQLILLDERGQKARVGSFIKQ